MKKIYIYLLFLFGFLFLAIPGYSQVNPENTSINNNQNIEGLTIYPNPVSTGKLYISTRLNQTKEINIFDVLGKKIISETLIGQELNISQLPPGVYVIKIRENEFSATRKLVIR